MDSNRRVLCTDGIVYTLTGSIGGDVQSTDLLVTYAFPSIAKLTSAAKAALEPLLWGAASGDMAFIHATYNRMTHPVFSSSAGASKVHGDGGTAMRNERLVRIGASAGSSIHANDPHLMVESALSLMAV